VNRYWRNFRGMTVLSKEAKSFKQEVATLARMAGVLSPLQCEVSIDITYHPKARKKETAKPMRRLDLDNPIKATLDSLNGIAYLDDYQVTEITARLGQPTEQGELVVMWEAA
jgi:crossover junction endodeoxyribonuclease RusA